MSSPGSISQWIDLLKSGNPSAAQPLWERYFAKMVTLAHRRLQGAPRGLADQEDIALSAFASFCRGVALGRFPRLHDRNDLWGLLIVITTRKAADLRTSEGRQKRGGGMVRAEADLRREDDGAGPSELSQAAGDEPTPEFAAQVAEEYQRLLGVLADDVLRSVAIWKMEGWSNEEIADKLKCVPRTVERKLRVIRSLWAGASPTDSPK